MMNFIFQAIKNKVLHSIRYTIFVALIISIFCIGITEGLAEDNPINPPQTVLQVQPLFAFFQHMYNGFFNEPMGVYFDPKSQEIFVADTKNDLIGIFNSSGISLFAFGGNDDIKEPVKVISDGQGRILVLDIGRSKIKVYNYRGEFLKNLEHPELQGKKIIGTMTFDHEGNLYIGENESGQILVFDPKLNLKLKFGGNGEGKGKFKSISSIAIDKRDGKIYVTDHQNNPAVQVFDRNGNYLLGWGEHQMGPNNFSLPGGIAIDSRGRIFVADTLRQDIKIFSSEGKLIDRFGGMGYRAGQVSYPVDIAIDPSDKIYVVEKTGRRVQVFQEVEIPVKPRS